MDVYLFVLVCGWYVIYLQRVMSCIKVGVILYYIYKKILHTDFIHSKIFAM